MDRNLIKSANVTPISSAANESSRDELAAAKHNLSLQVEAFTRLHSLSVQLAGAIELRPSLQAILQTLIDLHGAQYGLLSLHDPVSGDLVEQASVGFSEEMLKTAGKLTPQLGAGACGTAFVTKKRKIVEDTEIDPCFENFRELAREVGFRAVHSTPIPNREREIIGVLSVHFTKPYHPTSLDLQLADMCARQAAEVVEIIRTQTALVEADRKKDEFLAILAHELRNPLAPIRNGLSILEHAEDNPELRRETRKVMERQVDQLVRLVDDLMDVSRITRGKIDIYKERVDLAAIINSAIETARPLIESLNHQLTVNWSSSPIYLEADFVRLSQVFVNLLNNAAKYTDAGGNITITLRRDGANAFIDIRDTGIGIEPEAMPHIFDMFSQVDDALTRSRGGLGIGLTLVKKMVVMHGGNVSATSEGRGKGSCFTVRMPLAPALETQQTRPVSPMETRNLRILVIDDNEAAAQTMGWAMEIAGHTIRLAHSGPAALEIATEFLPEVILLDIGLPGMNGYEVCRLLRQMPETKNAIFIAQTGWGQEKHRKLSKEAGFHHHLVKPVDFKSLQEILNETK